MSRDETDVHTVLSVINAAWRGGCPLSMQEHLHPDFTMVLPGFARAVRGREALVASLEEFCKNAKVLEYEETDEHIDVVGNCAVVTFHFKMLYERSTYREDSSGRDMWVFQYEGSRWTAIWRTMLELSGERSSI